MPILKVVNVKCGGCAQSITCALEKAGFKNVVVDKEKQTVSFEGDPQVAGKLLAEKGYPEAGSPQAESILKKAKSYVSCAVGRIKK